MERVERGGRSRLDDFVCEGAAVEPEDSLDANVGDHDNEEEERLEADAVAEGWHGGLGFVGGEDVSEALRHDLERYRAHNGGEDHDAEGLHPGFADRVFVLVLILDGPSSEPQKQSNAKV
jgi:hypothetical protein